MRDIDAAIMAQLESGEITPFILVGLDIDGGKFYTDCDVPVPYGGNLYQPHSFSADAINYSLNTVVDTAKITIDDLDDDLKPEFVGGNPQGAEVYIWSVLLDADYKVVADAHVSWFEGDLGEWEYRGQRLAATISNMFARWNQQTLNRHSPSCRYKVFADTKRCQYAGAETWCDRTYSRCAALGNQINFGGQRWLPSIENAKIWWGAEPANA